MPKSRKPPLQVSFTPRNPAVSQVWSAAQKRWIETKEPLTRDQQNRELIAYMETTVAPLKVGKARAKAGKASAAKRAKAADHAWQKTAAKLLAQWVDDNKPPRYFASVAEKRLGVSAKTIRRWMKTAVKPA